MKIADFCIQVNDFFKDPSTCDFFIKLFEQEKLSHEKVRNAGKPDFTQLELSKVSDNYAHETINQVQMLFADIAESYVSFYNEKRAAIMPTDYVFEGLRIKRYLPEDNEMFDYHVDAISKASCTRFLTMFVYLNDVEEGGETVFPSLGFKIQPKKNSLFIFPPMWMYPHLGEKPISGPKYLLSTYLHFK